MEAKLRAQYHLGKLLDARGESSEYRTEFEAAQREKASLWGKYASYVPYAVKLDDATACDHMVSMESGRTASGQWIPGQTTEMDKICRTMRENFESAVPDDQALAPQNLVRHLRYVGRFPLEM